MEAACSSKTSAQTYPTQCKIPEDHQFNNSCLESWKTYIRTVIVSKDIPSKTGMLYIVD
jgi:hypothetical protein